MLLQEVFDQLACSELNNIYVTDQVTKELLPEHYKKVATAINAGLTQLHTQFQLRRGEITIVLQPGQTVYQLNRRNMAPRSEVPGAGKFIRYTSDFSDNMLKILQVFDDQGQELGMNNHTDYYSVHETSMDTMVVPLDFYEKRHVRELRVVYLQDHKRIPAGCEDLDPECYGLTLPRSHLWALCLFVAGRMHVPIGLQDATYSGNSFMALFNNECARLQEKSMDLSYLGASTGIVRQGFP